MLSEHLWSPEQWLGNTELENMKDVQNILKQIKSQKRSWTLEMDHLKILNCVMFLINSKRWMEPNGVPTTEHILGQIQQFISRTRKKLKGLLSVSLTSLGK